MSSPYINTELYTNILLHSNQMDNKIYLHLKKNLESHVLNKCFRDYGFITQVYEILSYDHGHIDPENMMVSAIFDITFSCRLCKPLRMKSIIGQVDRVNKLLLTVTNGPILVIITNERINDKIFFTDNNNNLRYKQDNNSVVLKPKEFVVVTLLSTTFNDGDYQIKAIGFLENMATDKQKKQFYSDLYSSDSHFVEYDKYIESK